MHFLSTRLFYYTYAPCTSILQFYGLDVVFKNTLFSHVIQGSKVLKRKTFGRNEFKILRDS